MVRGEFAFLRVGRAERAWYRQKPCFSAEFAAVLAVLIQKLARDDTIGRPLEPDRAAAPGPQNGDSQSLDRPKRVVSWRRGRSLAGDNQAWPGPFIKPFRVGCPAAVVRSKHHFRRRLGPSLFDQIVKAGELEVTCQKQVSTGAGDVEHEAAGVVARLWMPGDGWMPDDERHACGLPRLGCRHRVESGRRVT